MSTKFTPGPWEVNDDRFWVRSSVTESVVATIEKDLHEKGEQQANAHLIAAAPELLAAAEFLLEWCPTCSVGSSGYARQEQLKAAIRKARGVA